ncbi:RHS repeat-associated core domain protein [Lysobacter capsici]|nr:RHS repeat-associated core domain protein [Lysobacter capsici]
MTAIKKRAITETKVELTYGIPTEISQVNAWDYTASVGATGDEPVFVAALKAYYDQKSSDRGCTPNTTVTRGAEWATLSQWSDGVSQRQQAGFNVKWNRKSSGVCSLYNDVEFAVRLRTRCSNQYLAWNAPDNTCSDDFYVARLTAPPLYCDSCTLVGDPVDFSTGDQYETENDIDLSWIRFDRYYHSVTSNAAAGFGYGWTHSHDIRLAIQGTTDPTLGLVQANGSHLPFRNQGTYYEAVDGSGDRIIASGINWVLQQTGGSLTFNAAGQLLEQHSDHGTALTYGYDVVGRLITITHSTGRSLTIAYSGVAANAPIASLTSAGSVLAAYTYNPNGQVATVTYPAGIATRTYHYEDPNFPQNLTGISVESIQGGARYSTFAYDSQGRSVSAQLAGGVDGVTVAYSAQGGAVVTDALGDATDYSLTTAGAATKPRKAGDLTDSKGVVKRTYYDDGSDFRRRIDTVKDRNGTTTKHTYTEANDPVTGQPAWTHAITEAFQTSLARTSEERRDSATNRVILTRFGDRETRITRNARLQPISVTVRDTTTNQTRTTAYAYCEAGDVAASNSTCPILGMLKSVDGPRTDVNDVARFEYYGSDDTTCATTPELCTYRKGDLRKTVDALGRATEIAGYDPQGRPLSVIDANGVVTDYVYHPRGWLAAIKQRGANNSTETDDLITRISYYPPGMVETMSIPGRGTTNYNYDAALRLTSFDDGSSDKVRFTLDNAGNRTLAQTKTASGLVKQTRSWVYNALGQLTALKDAAQNATVFSYDKEGNLELTTDALGRKTRQSYDPLNRLISTLQDVDTLQADTKMEYNALDQVTKVTDPNGLDTVYAYNGFGDQTQLTSPDTGVATYTYNSAGLLATKHDANDAAAHRYTYDALNRPTAVFYTAAGPADVEYDYDTVNGVCAADETFALGRVTAMRTEGTELKYCYDRFGQMVRKVQSVNGQSFTLRYAFNKGFLQSITYPDGAIADYIYTGTRILEIGITPAAGTRSVVVKNGFYNPLGPIASWTYGNGRSLQRTYDLDYRPKTIRDIASGGLSLGYGYNTVGDLTELKDGLLSTFQAKYDYDALGRLTVTRDGNSNDALETYEYDKTGNRKKLLHGGITDLYVLPTDSHRLSSVGGVSRSYDAVGNTTAIGGKEYVYNANDRMKQVKQGGVVIMGYSYNAIGERVAAINGDTGPVTTYTLYDESGQWIGDYDSTGATIQQAIWMDNLPVGLLVGAGTAQSLKFVQPDHLGTPRAVIDPTRNVAIWTWDAKGEAFGNSPPNQDPDLDGNAFVFNMRFPGQRYDAASELIYNYFRDYDPTTGRYIQSDPLGLNGGISAYGYVGGNPLGLTDQYGLYYSMDNVPWYNFPGKIGAWFDDLAHLSMMRTYNGPSESIDNAIVEHYETAGAFILSVETLALPEVAMARVPIRARFCPIGAKAVKPADFFKFGTVHPRVAQQQLTKDFHSFSPAIERYAEKFAETTAKLDKYGRVTDKATMRGEMKTSKGWVQGTYEWVKNESGQIYHRLFRPDK